MTTQCSHVYSVLANVMPECSHSFGKCGRNSGCRGLYNGLPIFAGEIYTHLYPLFRSWQSQLGVMGAHHCYSCWKWWPETIWETDTLKVMTALIVRLPSECCCQDFSAISWMLVCVYVLFCLECFAGPEPGWHTSALQSCVWRRSCKWCNISGSVSGCSKLQFWCLHSCRSSGCWGQFFVSLLYKHYFWCLGKSFLFTSDTCSNWSWVQYLTWICMTLHSQTVNHRFNS